MNGNIGVILVGIVAIGIFLFMQQRPSVFIGAAGCGGLTGATLKACQSKQSTLYKKPKPIIAPKPRPRGITPAPRRAGKTQRPATRKDFEREQRENPRRRGESEDAQQRRILAANKAKRRAAAMRKIRALEKARFEQIKKIVIARLRARIRALQANRTGYRPVVAGMPNTAPVTQGANQMALAMKCLLQENCPVYEVWTLKRQTDIRDRIRKQCSGAANSTNCYLEQERLQITNKLERESLLLAQRRGQMRIPGAAQEDTPPGTQPQNPPRTSPGGFGDPGGIKGTPAKSYYMERLSNAY